MCDNLSHLVKLFPRVLGIRQHLRNDEIAIAERCFDLSRNVISPLRKKPALLSQVWSRRRGAERAGRGSFHRTTRHMASLV